MLGGRPRPNIPDTPILSVFENSSVPEHQLVKPTPTYFDSVSILAAESSVMSSAAPKIYPKTPIIKRLGPSESVPTAAIAKKVVEQPNKDHVISSSPTINAEDQASTTSKSAKASKKLLGQNPLSRSHRQIIENHLDSLSNDEKSKFHSFDAKEKHDYLSKYVFK